ncbi:MAG: hypothetical protein ACE5IR_14415 [bacterium]
MEAMKSFYKLFLIGLIILTVPSLCCTDLIEDGGSPAPTAADIEAAKEKVELANQAFGEAVGQARELDINHPEDVDQLDDISGFKTARDLYAQALELDPNNLDADLGMAVTQLIILKDDDALKSMRDEWIDYGENDAENVEAPRVSLFNVSFPTRQEDLDLTGAYLTGSLVKTSKLLIKSPPLASETQKVVRDLIIPSLDISVAKMEKIVESDSNQTYTFTVSSAMQGGTQSEPEDPVELDLTDFKTFYASLLSSRAVLRLFLAYNLDVDIADSSDIVRALTQTSDFFTLNEAAEIKEAKNDFIKSADALLDAIGFLRAETDNQDDDFITVDPDGEDDLDEIEKRTQQARDAVNGEVTVTEDFDEDINTADSELVISLKAFFDNPPARPKELLPSYILEQDVEDGESVDQFVWTAQSITAWQFPDPTMGGILPEMTNSRLKEIFGLSYIPGDIDLTVGSGTKPVYSWNDSPISHLTVYRLSDLQIVWEIHHQNYEDRIFSPVTHGVVPASAAQENALELSLIPGQLYRVSIYRDGNGNALAEDENEVRDFIVQ